MPRLLKSLLLVCVIVHSSRELVSAKSIRINSFNVNSLDQLSSKQDSPILFPFPDTPIPTAETSFLPNLGFLTDLGTLLLPDLPASGFVKLGRDLLESEQCVEKVSCMVTGLSSRHSYLNWLHNFLTDFPFEGDLADRMKNGAVKQDGNCEYSCNPTKTMRRAFGVMRLLNEIVNLNIVAHRI